MALVAVLANLQSHLAKFISHDIHGFGKFLGALLVGAVGFCIVVSTGAGLSAEVDEFFIFAHWWGFLNCWVWMAGRWPLGIPSGHLFRELLTGRFVGWCEQAGQGAGLHELHVFHDVDDFLFGYPVS